ncbi:MAG: tyrosine-type recombinase/integrase, partial [Anaerolineales bacterium]
MDDSHSDLPLFSRMATSSSIETESPSSLHPTTSLSAAINAWGEALEDQGKSIHTVKAFTSDLRLLAQFVGSGRAINDISTIDIKNFLDWMLNTRGVPCSPKTYARRITSIKSFFRWLKEIGVLTEDPAAAVPQQSVLSPLPSVLNDDEVKAVLETAASSRNHEKADARPFTLLSLLLETAIKKGECLAIHINHIDPNSVDGPILFVRYG